MVRPDGLRVVFFGTPAFALPTLNALLASPHAVVGVVTRPDRPAGRGQHRAEPPVKSRSRAFGVPVVQPSRLQDADFPASLAALSPDVFVVVAYGKLLTQAVLAVPRLGVFNVHASLLPRYRGAAPVHRAVINGEPETGVTIMRMVQALDAGPVLAMARRPIGPDETSDEVERALAVMGASLLVATLEGVVAGTISEEPQDESAATYAARLTRAEGAIDWQLAAPTLHNLIRGLHPWPHAFTFHADRRLILLRATPVAGPPAAPGTVVQASGDDLHVATGTGLLAITELQPEGKRAMSPREFLSGHQLAVGDRLTSVP
jgi:methionyl-tRNA formyltransferase